LLVAAAMVGSILWSSDGGCGFVLCMCMYECDCEWQDTMEL
jgi:hypothetical protein